MKTLDWIIALALALAGCGAGGAPSPASPTSSPTRDLAAVATPTARPITAAEVEGHLRFLADDLLEGRGMGSRGLELAALYHEATFRALGFEPAFDDSYRQPFTLRGSTPDREPTLALPTEGEPVTFTPWEQFVLGTHRDDVEPQLEGELVYAGHLIDAPEHDWDDLGEADLRGKILLVEINEPGNEEGGIFEGTAMTYYGRWTYKFEKASELGALGVLIIHTLSGATYDWSVVRNSWSKEDVFVPGQHLGVGFYGWVTEAVGEQLLSASGEDADELRQRAQTREFEPVPLGVRLRVAQEPTFRELEAENVGGLLRGTHPERRDRTVVVTAHFDHLGRDPELEGEDQIYNGAVDNCTASATMLALARRLADEREALGLDVLFLALSAEEVGLLGSRSFTAHPPVPIDQIWANLNLEMTSPWIATRDVYAIGAGHSELDAVAGEAAGRLDLEYLPEQGREHGFFFRSDQMSFARAGVPAVWLHEGPTAVGDDPEAVTRAAEQFRSERYHQVSDELDEGWPLDGAVQIARWARQIIHVLDERTERPTYLESSYFARD